MNLIAELEKQISYCQADYNFSKIHKLTAAIKIQTAIEAGVNPHANYIVKCTRKGCKFIKHAVIPKRVDINGDIKADYPHWIYCTEHPNYTIWSQVNGILSEDHTCDARCVNAKGNNCECSCGGENHGKAWS